MDPRSGTYSEDVMDILTILKSNHVETVYACSYLDLCIEVIFWALRRIIVLNFTELTFPLTFESL